MPENEFEKQVHDKLSGLKLSPSDPVWENVSKAIAQKKKRRRLLFILPLVAGLLLLGYSGYRFLGPTRKAAPIATPANLEPPRTDSNRAVELTQETKTVPVSTIPSTTTKITTTPAQSPIPSNNTRLQATALNAGSTRKNNHRPLPRNSEPPTTNLPNLARVNSTAVVQPTREQLFENTVPAQLQAGKKPETNSSLLTEKPVLQPTSIRNDTTNTSTKTTAASTPELTKEPIIAIPTKKKTTHRTQFGLTIATGRADVRREVFSFNKSSLRTADNSPITANPGGPPANLTSPPSETKRGMAFKLGISWERNLGRRTKLLSGIGYAFFSDHIRVGQRNNGPLFVQYNNYSTGQIINGYYLAQTFEDFTNRFHFIEIPLQLEWQLNKAKRWPITWDLGFSYTHLLSTNALTYDTASGGAYYHDRSLFNKDHFNLLTGLSLHLHGRRIDASIGPSWSIDMTRTVKQGFDRNKYLLAGFVKAQVMFLKKEKK